jgi:hypothetical protein
MKPTSNTYFGRYRIYLRKASTGLLIAPVSPQLWSNFIDSLVDVAMTLITFAFLIVCICAYPLAVPLFALCESDRRTAKAYRAFLARMSKGDCIDWRDEADPPTFTGVDHSSGPDQTAIVRHGFCEKAAEGWYCHRKPDHDGPCAATKDPI